MTEGNNTLLPWDFAPDTTQIPEEDYADLTVIDISQFREFDPDTVHPLSPEDEATQNELVAAALNAFRTTGFLVMKGHGLTPEQIHHQFDLGKMFCDDVSEEEKHRLHARIAQDGSWAGYKPQGYYRRPGGSFDSVEHYDFYPWTAVEHRLPDRAKSYLSDFRQFIEYNHFVILRKVLGILSQGLGLPINTLWDLHTYEGRTNDNALRGPPDCEIEWKHSKDHLRYVMYYPPSEEDRIKQKKLWVPGHTDLGSVTFLYSQPIAGLQVLSLKNQRWQYVRHYPNHIIVDLGDSMEFLTGGVLKASPHRVMEPPPDQRHLRRQGIFCFFPFMKDVVLSPLDYPSLRALGSKDLFQEYIELGGKPFKSDEWLVQRSKLVGSNRIIRSKRDMQAVLEDIHFRYNP